jgi:hypothetical protein
VPAYPFSQRPTFSEFKQALQKQGCQYLTLNVQVGKQDSYPVPYFMREVGGEPLTAVAVFDDDERVEFSDIRRICKKLQVPTDIFGLDLTDLDEPTN